MAIYDLVIEPSTFDVLWFLMAAEQRRGKIGLKFLHVVFAGGASAESADYHAVVSRSSQRDRITNILVPSAWAVPNVNGIEVLDDRRELRARLAGYPVEHVFPKNYSVTLHRSCIVDCIRDMLRLQHKDALEIFQASEAALSYIDRWIAAHAGGCRVVSITLRHYDYMPARNSNLVAWARFARYLMSRSYRPVFIPDTETIADGIPEILDEFPYLTEAAWNLNLRIALYERAFLNLGINSGPANFFVLSAQIRGLMFKMTTPGVPQAEASFLAERGFEIGGQLPFCAPFQKLVWENDDFEVIKREFDEMERRILDYEAQQPGPEA